MRKSDLSRWAAISEIVATVAVVISLLLVAYSTKRNTDEMETANANFLYQIDEQITADLSVSPQLASIYIKVAKKEALTEIEKFQYVYLQHRSLAVWEIAWTHYKGGSLGFVEWFDWDQYKTESLKAELPKEWWLEIRPPYKPGFANHVDAIYTDI